jgi:hypothetical protein
VGAQTLVLSSRGRRPAAAPEAAFVLDGTARYADARDCADIPFERCTPVRDFPTWPGKRNYSGRYWSVTMGDHVPYESLYERTALLELDRDPSVVAISSQPMWLHWPKSQGGRSHAPDFFVRHSSGDGELVDVRPRELIKPKAAEVFAATEELCKRIGLAYRVISDLDQVLDRNLSALTRYAIPAWAPPEELWPLLDAPEFEPTIRGIAAALQRPEGPPALGWVYWLIWHGVLAADLSQPLSLATPLTAHLTEGQR